MTRKTKEDRLNGYLVGIVGFFTLGILNLLSAWLVMLGLGVAHHQWAAVPAFGYWATYLLLAAVSSLAGQVKGGMKVETKD